MSSLSSQSLTNTHKGNLNRDLGVALCSASSNFSKPKLLLTLAFFAPLLASLVLCTSNVSTLPSSCFCWTALRTCAEQNFLSCTHLSTLDSQSPWNRPPLPRCCPYAALAAASEKSKPPPSCPPPPSWGQSCHVGCGQSCIFPYITPATASCQLQYKMTHTTVNSGFA